eukprot:9881244-Alexandrium_andersonii.AAC.1
MPARARAGEELARRAGHQGLRRPERPHGHGQGRASTRIADLTSGLRWRHDRVADVCDSEVVQNTGVFAP